MRILHTSDWHLGHRLYGRSRYEEFAGFLDWLAAYIAEHAVEVLLVAGDIFDTTTPGNRTLELYYRFLHHVSRGPCRAVVIIAGNHDSPTLLEAPKDLLRQFQVHVTGVPAVDPKDQVVYIPGQGDDGLLVCSVPFLRDRDIRLAGAGESQEGESRPHGTGDRAALSTGLRCGPWRSGKKREKRFLLSGWGICL